MRRAIAAAVVVLVAGAGLTAARAASDDAPVLTATAQFHQLKYFPQGSYQTCEIDNCGTFEGGDLVFRLPPRATPYSGTITASFAYKTSGSQRFSNRAYVRDDKFHYFGAHPGPRPLVAAPHGDTRTVVVGLCGLPGGRDIHVFVVGGVGGVGDVGAGRATIGLTSVTEELRLS